MRLAVVYAVTDVPLDDHGVPMGEERARPLTEEEWIATYCRDEGAVH